ncbi:MAG: hypothetical protein ACXVZW_09890 [Gaiellaceae bacterium]
MERYAVVSCHVERPLDDEVWSRFEVLQERRPGGFPIAALMRPPDDRGGERERQSLWLERARAAAERAPFGLHTHWTAPDHARPAAGIDAAALVRSQLAWLAGQALRPSLFVGGGWYSDPEVVRVVAESGLVDCTPTRFRPSYLAPGAARLSLAEPAVIVLPGGAELEAVPSTRSLGMLLRSLAAPNRLDERVVHLYFHDTDLLDRRRALLLRAGLGLLARRRLACDHAALLERLGELRRVPLLSCLEAGLQPEG